LFNCLIVGHKTCKTLKTFFFSAGESGQLARFPAATRLRAATRFSLDFIIVLYVLSVL
jgi:hypothetical protein